MVRRFLRDWIDFLLLCNSLSTLTLSEWWHVLWLECNLVHLCLSITFHRSKMWDFSMYVVISCQTPIEIEVVSFLFPLNSCLQFVTLQEWWNMPGEFGWLRLDVRLCQWLYGKPMSRQSKQYRWSWWRGQKCVDRSHLSFKVNVGHNLVTMVGHAWMDHLHINVDVQRLTKVNDVRRSHQYSVGFFVDDARRRWWSTLPF